MAIQKSGGADDFSPSLAVAPRPPQAAMARKAIEARGPATEGPALTAGVEQPERGFRRCREIGTLRRGIRPLGRASGSLVARGWAHL